MSAKKQTWPTAPDQDGYYFATAEEQEQRILTKDYENGSQTKQVTLSNGKVAVVRKLKGRDFVETKKQVQADKSSDFETVNMAVATKIDGEQYPPEFYLDDLFQNDYSLILVAYGYLNFQ